MTRFARRSWTKKILLRCSLYEVRAAFLTLLTSVFEVICPVVRDSYFDEIEDEDEVVGMEVTTTGEGGQEEATAEVGEDEASDKQPALVSDDSMDSAYVYAIGQDSDDLGEGRTVGRFKFWRASNCVTRFIGSLFCLLPEAPKFFKRFDHLFSVFDRFARIGEHEALLLIACGAVPRLMDIYQGTAAKVPLRCLTVDGTVPSPTNRSKMSKSNDSFANFGPLLSTLAALAASGALYNTAKGELRRYFRM